MVSNISENATGTIPRNDTLTLPNANESTANLAFRISLIIVGMVGNLLLMTVVWKDKTYRPGTRILTMNVAVSAFLTIALGNGGITLFTYFHMSGACTLYAIYCILVVTANWAEVTLAVNRLVAVCFLHHYHRFTSPKAGGLVCCLTWVIGAVVTVLLGLSPGSSFKEVRPGVCLPIATNSAGRLWLSMSVFIPILTCAVPMLTISVDLLKHASGSGNVAVMPMPSRRRLGERKKIQLVRAMMASSLWNACSSLPYVIAYNYANAVVLSSLVSNILRFMFNAQIAINSFVFLIFYGGLSTLKCQISSSNVAIAQQQQDDRGKRITTRSSRILPAENTGNEDEDGKIV